MKYLPPSQTVNQGQKIEYVVKVTGTKPVTVTWYRNGTTKLKSSKNSKIVYTQGDAKLTIMEAEATDDGEYKLEAVNKFGTDSKTSRVNVIREFGRIWGCFGWDFERYFWGFFFWWLIIIFVSNLNILNYLVLIGV